MGKRTISPLNIESRQLLQIFLISAITALLTLRLYLHLSGYPQIGGRTLHIAHMLPGGLLMMAAIIIGIIHPGYRISRVTALIGGIGFGVFIDELGKFITKDNNYFYQPTVAILYIIFVSLFIFYTYISREQKYTNNDYLSTIYYILSGVSENTVDKDTKNILKDHQSKLLPGSEKIMLGLTISSLQTKEKTDHLFSGFHQRINQLIGYGLNSVWAKRVLFLYFFIQVGSITAVGLRLLYDLVTSKSLELLSIGELDSLSVSSLGYFISSLISGTLLVIGALSIQKSHRRALEFFHKSVLVNIFLLQIFTFYREQFSALAGLALNLVLLILLNYVIKQLKTDDS